jgi:hypothetical protein
MLIKITSPRITSTLYSKNKNATVRYINPKYIVRVIEYIGEHLHEGWHCSKITVSEGNTSFDCYDTRLPDEFVQYVNSII